MVDGSTDRSSLSLAVQVSRGLISEDPCSLGSPLGNGLSRGSSFTDPDVPYILCHDHADQHRLWKETAGIGQKALMWELEMAMI
jgi:hypothetical protein